MYWTQTSKGKAGIDIYNICTSYGSWWYGAAIDFSLPFILVRPHCWRYFLSPVRIGESNERLCADESSAWSELAWLCLNDVEPLALSVIPCLSTCAAQMQSAVSVRVL